MLYFSVLWMLKYDNKLAGQLTTHMLIVTGKKITEFSIPLGFPVFAVVIHLTKLRAPVQADE